MDEQRALLDQLMGSSRDFTSEQKERVHKIRFTDQDVCKDYVCGLCPHVAFAGTKSDLVGACYLQYAHAHVAPDGIKFLCHRGNAVNEYAITSMLTTAEVNGNLFRPKRRIVMGTSFCEYVLCIMRKTHGL